MKKFVLLLGLIAASCGFISAQAPANAPDVMLQGFYWDSYTDKGYGSTRWNDVQNMVDEIAESFDLVWLPPSAKSSGGTGYHPKEWSNQNSDWGTAPQLKKLISSFKAKGTRCVADIVVNHRDGNYNWADFCNENFGTYGSFTLYPSAQFICKDDECTKNGHSATGNKDAGYDYNCEASGGYCASRDLDHSNTTIQKAIKAYLKWMKNEMGYDGWRYDLVKGYLGKYTKDYNAAGGAYMSVGEYWDGNYDAVKNWINETGKTSMAFDFPNKYAAFNNGLASNNFGAMVNGYKVPNGLCGADEMKRYAVTFIDNHDTFRDGSKYGGDWTKANAVLLAQPGIPCVFYPHWKECKADIKKMIATRKAMGVHSQSACTTAGGGSYYQSTTTGKNGTLICFVGSGWSDPAGYTKACSGNGWAYYTSSQVVVPDTPVGPVDPDTPVPSQSYAIRVNGTTDYPAEYKGVSSVDSSFEEYMASVELKAGDTFVTYDLVNKAGWVMEVEPYGEYANFEVGTESVKCTKAGCYDFYIKMKFQADIMYIGPGTGCGSSPVIPEDPDTPVIPDTPVTPDTPVGGTGYSLYVNGKDLYNMEDQGAWDMDPSYNQFALPNVSLKAGDTFVFYNNSNGETWGSVTVDNASIASITGSGTDFSVSEDGCYSVYLKLKFQADNVYFGAGTDCSSAPLPDTPVIPEDPDTPVVPDTPVDPDTPVGPAPSGDYYLVGWINGADYGFGEDWATVGDYKFVNGKLTVTFAEDSYVCLKTGDNENWFSTATYVPVGTSGTAVFEKSSETIFEKVGVPAGTVYFTLSDNGNGTLTLSYTTDASAIIEAESVNMVIYPNPTSDYITISCDEAIEEVVINAINGSEVIRTNSNEIDLSALNPSMYFVNVMLQNGDVVRSKVIRK